MDKLRLWDKIWKVHMTFTPQVVVSFTLLVAQTDTMERFMVIRSQQVLAFCSKQMGSHSYIGQDSFTITATGNQPTSTVTLTLTSSDTGEMIPLSDQGTKTIPANSNWNTPLSIYVSAVQDNTTDSNTTPNLVITTSSSDASWNGLTFTFL